MATIFNFPGYIDSSVNGSTSTPYTAASDEALIGVIIGGNGPSITGGGSGTKGTLVQISSTGTISYFFVLRPGTQIDFNNGTWYAARFITPAVNTL